MQKPVYKIRNWDAFFEKSHKDTEVAFRWVAIPTKHDGSGFRRVASNPRATDIFAAWVLILQVAAKMPKRGVLEDDGGPLDAEDLAIRTGFPITAFDLALKVLTDKKIAWLEMDGSRDVVATNPDVVVLHDSTEQDNTRQGCPTDISAEPPNTADSAPSPRPDEPSEAAGGALSGGADDAVVLMPDGSPWQFPIKVKGKGRNAGKAVWPLRQSKLDEYVRAYPDLNVPSHLRAALQWTRDNPGKRKLFDGMPAFLTRWMNTALERNGSHGPPSSRAAPLTAREAARQRFDTELEALFEAPAHDSPRIEGVRKGDQRLLPRGDAGAGGARGGDGGGDELPTRRRGPQDPRPPSRIF